MRAASTGIDARETERGRRLVTCLLSKLPQLSKGRVAQAVHLAAAPVESVPHQEACPGARMPAGVYVGAGVGV